MKSDRDWEYVRADHAWRIEEAGTGLLRAALLFGSVAVALTLLVVPMLDRGSQPLYTDNAVAGLDVMSTGSIRPGTNTYTIRRSVLQPSPNSICVIRENGSRMGEC